ncbi:MAG: hypothetical protein ACR2NZ_10555 [Rubripirellula sp.]
MMIRETGPTPESEDMSIEEFDSMDVMSPEDALDAIQDVVDDVDEYVLEWFKRLNDGLVNDGSSTTSDRDLRARIREFREEKRQWEAKREVQQLELQEKMRQLTDAWLRLEDEQRVLLQRRDSAATSSREKTANRDASRSVEPSSKSVSTTSAEKTAPSHIATVASSAPPSQPRAASNDGESKRPAAARVSQPDDAAVRQFQQLRREIESSRPRPGLG